MEVPRQKGWGCGLADRDVVALSQVNGPMKVKEVIAGSIELIVVLMTLVHSRTQLRLEIKIR